MITSLTNSEPNITRFSTLAARIYHNLSIVTNIKKILVFIGVTRQRPYLLGVYPEEGYLTDIIQKSLHFFSINRPGPRNFLSSYEEYFYILNGDAKQDLLQFFALEPPPYLKVNLKSWRVGSSFEYYMYRW